MAENTKTVRDIVFGENSSTDPIGGTVLSLVRIVVSFLWFLHSLQGLFGAFGGIDGQGAAVPFGDWPGWWGKVIELVGGALLMLGLFTRPVAVLCSGAMAYGYFTVHQPMALLPLQNMGEQAALYCWIFLLIAVIGPGRIALDRVWRTAGITSGVTNGVANSAAR